jgi:hypothetical protein
MARLYGGFWPGKGRTNCLLPVWAESAATRDEVRTAIFKSRMMDLAAIVRNPHVACVGGKFTKEIGEIGEESPPPFDVRPAKRAAAWATEPRK